ncbi:exonuclease domain-containing protein [Actinosynnema sp. CA-299493]
MYRNEVPEHLMTTAQLRSSGLQPGDAAVAAGWLERVFEGDVWLTVLHDVRSATSLLVPPLRPVPAVEAPQAATAPAARSAAAAWARDMLRNQDAVMLDTELTDFAGRVIEIAVLAVDGTVLLSTLVDPEGAPINPHAQRTHGISAAMLTRAPTMAQVWPQLDEVLRGKVVLAWNAPFDQSRLHAEHQLVTGGAPPPEWLARKWECAMRRHAAWVGEPNKQGSGYRNHKLEGGHRATGDCEAALERLAQMAATAPGSTHPTSSSTSSSSSSSSEAGHAPDLRAVDEVWPKVMGEVRSRSRSTEAMLANAERLAVADRTLVIRHPSLPLNRRLAQDRTTAAVNEALVAVLGRGWRIRVEGHDAHSRTTAPPASADEPDGEHYHHWQDTREGLALEGWIKIAPERICAEVVAPAADESGGEAVDAFYAVDHSVRCPPDATCRTILDLADDDRFDEAMRLAEAHVTAA